MATARGNGRALRLLCVTAAPASAQFQFQPPEVPLVHPVARELPGVQLLALPRQGRVDTGPAVAAPQIDQAVVQLGAGPCRIESSLLARGGGAREDAAPQAFRTLPDRPDLVKQVQVLAVERGSRLWRGRLNGLEWTGRDWADWDWADWALDVCVMETSGSPAERRNGAQ